MAALEADIVSAGEVCADALLHGYRIYLCGNGGSAADAQHIAAELIGRFVSDRRSLPPNPLPDKWNANSIVFLNAGNVWGVDYDSSKDSDKIRSSAGLGLDWISPLGPLSFVFAQTLSSADGDLEESFSFQIGSSF